MGFQAFFGRPQTANLTPCSCKSSALKPFTKRMFGARAVITNTSVTCPQMILPSKARPNGPGHHTAASRCVVLSRAARSPSAKPVIS